MGPRIGSLPNLAECLAKGSRVQGAGNNTPNYSRPEGSADLWMGCWGDASPILSLSHRARSWPHTQERFVQQMDGGPEIVIAPMVQPHVCWTVLIPNDREALKVGPEGGHHTLLEALLEAADTPAADDGGELVLRQEVQVVPQRGLVDGVVKRVLPERVHEVGDVLP